LTKVLSYYKSKNVNIVIITSLIVSIIVTNSFVIFSSDENTRFYNAGLTSALTVGVGLVICLIQVYRYKRSIHRQEGAGKPHHYFDNNKMHLSICLFLGLWFTAHMIWVLEYQQSSGVSIADALWFVGYASFGYFLFNLYHHFFRKEFEPFVLILVAIIIAIALIFVLDSIVSILRLLSTQTVDLSVMLVTLVYPILDAVLFFPAVLIFWAVRRRSRNRGKDTTIQEQKVAEAKLGQGKTSFTSPLVAGTSSIWILLLSIAMMLSAIADTGYAYSAAYGPDTVQKEVWIWDIIYNADHLCLAAALIGYRHFFSFYTHDIGYNTEDTHRSSPKEEEL
jgi:hypothetical protein